jgi:hypothetical protein
MEMIITVLKELEYLKGLVKLGRRKNDETKQVELHIVGKRSKLHKEVICLNHMGKGRSIHLSVEIGELQVHGLDDAETSMFVISTSTMRELGLMHLVVGSKNYKTVLNIIT